MPSPYPDDYDPDMVSDGMPFRGVKRGCGITIAVFAFVALLISWLWPW
jgi:hypothetical protein